MNIAYHSSDSYSPVLGTSIVSLLVNNTNVDEINIYVIEDHISELNKNRLKDMVAQYNRNIFFIPMPDMNKTQNLGLKEVRSDWIFNSYCRLYLDQILPGGIERVLYLDSDVLVLGDLSELWNIDMQGKCVAGVCDALSNEYYEMLGMSKTAHYCNSGMQLQDLKVWKGQKVGDRVRDYVHKSGGYIFFMEQTVFNVVLQDNILVLPPKFNTYTLLQSLSYKELMKLRNPRDFYKVEEIEEAIKKPQIVHLTSTFLITNRAWFDVTNHPMKETYIRFKEMTPWKDEPLFRDTRNWSKKFIQFFVDYLPRPVVLGIAGYIYNGPRIKNIKRLMAEEKKEAL